MVQIAPAYATRPAPTTTADAATADAQTPAAKAARRRSLLVRRYQKLRAFGLRHLSAIQAREVIGQTVPAVLVAVPELPDDDNDDSAEPLTGAALNVCRMAQEDETAPAGRRVADALLSPSERARVRRDVTLARDADGWQRGRAAGCWLVLASV